jgi:enoyl-CoA hydratase/carnithine racemase
MASRIETRGHTLWMILDRPEASNAITGDELDLLEDALHTASKDDSVAAIVLTGTGRHFSAGVDLRMASTASPDELSRFLTRLQSVYRAVEQCACPVVAAVNGTTVAGGFELVMCCDIVIASRAARFADGHAAVGLIPSGGSTFRLPKLISPNRARELLYTGRFADADELERAGLVNTVVDDGELDRVVTATTEAIARNSAITTRRLKELIEAGHTLPTDDAMSAELAAALSHRNTPDAEEGLTAFFERRAAQFGKHPSQQRDSAVRRS